MPSADAVVVAGDSLEFRPAAIMSPTRTGKFSGGYVTLLGPNNPITPTISLKAASLIGPCLSLTLDARSTTGVPRGGNFSWTVTSVVPANNASHLAYIRGRLRKLPLASPVVVFAPNELLVGRTYVFALKVSNYLGGKAGSVSVQVTKTDQVVPLLTASGPTVATSATPLYLRADLANPANCRGRSLRLTYKWTLVNAVPTGTIDTFTPAITLDSRSSKTRVLYVAPSTLTQGNTYFFRVSASHTSLVTPLTADLFVQVVSTQLIARIADGNRQVSSILPLLLDASDSYDPQSATTPLAFAWSCAIEASASPCFATIPASFSSTASSSRLRVDTGLLPGKRYVLTVSVSTTNPVRLASASVSVDTAAINSIGVVAVGLQGPGSVSSRETLQLSGTLLGVRLASGQALDATFDKFEFSFAWSHSAGNVLNINNVRLSDPRTPNLALAPGALKAGVVVEFTLTVTARYRLTNENVTGTASTMVYVFSLPVSSADPPLVVSASQGIAMQTLFTLSCVDFTDELIPLRYRFKYIPENSATEYALT